jgi:heterodisulfide reductase subunit C
VSAIDLSFAQGIHEECGQDVNVCYQCRKCTAGCPIVDEMDLTPTQVVQAIRLGDKAAVLGSKTIWLCASCETCTTRCPQDLDLARVMDAARTLAVRQGVAAAVPDVNAFYRSMLQAIRLWGRVYELGMMGLFKLKTFTFTKDAGLALQMLKKGKIALLPHWARVIATNRIFARAKKLERSAP